MPRYCRHSHERAEEEEDYSDDFSFDEGSTRQPTDAAEGSGPRPVSHRLHFYLYLSTMLYNIGPFDVFIRR